MNDERAAEPVPPVEDQLEQILTDAERVLAELRTALAEQRQLARQHAEIDRLPEHLANTTVRWGQVRVFLQEMLDELRQRRSPHDGGHRATGGDDLV